MSYMRGEWHIVPGARDDVMHMVFFGPQSAYLSIPMCIFDQLVVMRFAEMRSCQRVAACEEALRNHGGNIGALPLQAMVQGKSLEQVNEGWYAGIRAMFPLVESEEGADGERVD